jgi:hypothetical protein
VVVVLPRRSGLRPRIDPEYVFVSYAVSEKLNIGSGATAVMALSAATESAGASFGGRVVKKPLMGGS